jgi:serine/threonine protein kinase
MIGEQVGRYLILEEIGRGGMGVVYKARDDTGGFVAIKILYDFLAGDATFVDRFFHEANIASTFSMDSIIRIHEILKHGRTFGIAMEYVDGETLADVIKRDGPLPLEKVREYGLQIAGALESIHNKDIIHRDVSSSNIMISQMGKAKLMDFGIAKNLSGITFHSRGIMGNPAFMSPEQGRGDPNVPIDRQSDIYSFGVVLFQMITGRLPHIAQTDVAMIHKHIYDDAPAPGTINPSIPKSVDAVILRALARDRAARYRTMSELILDMERKFPGGSMSALPGTMYDNPYDNIFPAARGAPDEHPSKTVSKVISDHVVSSTWKYNALVALLILLLVGIAGIAVSRNRAAGRLPAVKGTPVGTAMSPPAASPQRLGSLSFTRPERDLAVLLDGVKTQPEVLLDSAGFKYVVTGITPGMHTLAVRKGDLVSEKTMYVKEGENIAASIPPFARREEITPSRTPDETPVTPATIAPPRTTVQQTVKPRATSVTATVRSTTASDTTRRTTVPRTRNTTAPSTRYTTAPTTRYTTVPATRYTTVPATVAPPTRITTVQPTTARPRPTPEATHTRPLPTPE